MWPFKKGETATDDKLEKRDTSATDVVVAGILARAGGAPAVKIEATSALEACSGFVGRAFAGAELTGPDYITEALPPSMLNLIGRSLIISGELVLRIRVEDGMLMLDPCADHDVTGGADARGWFYRLNVAGPSRVTTVRHVPREGVVHLTYSVSASEPWRGRGPLQVASESGRLSAETVSALADEASAPRGSFLPLPADGDDPTVSAMKADVRGASGNILFVEAGDADVVQGGGGNRAEYKVERFGADPPEGLIDLARRASTEVFAACGLSSSLFADQAGATPREIV